MKIVLSDGKNWDINVNAYIIPVLSGVLIVFGTAYPALTIACFLLNIIYVLCASAKETFRLLFFLLPFAQVYKVLSLTDTSLFTILELLAVVVLFFKRSRVKGTFLMLMLIWAGYVLLGSRMNVLQWIKQMMVPLLVYLFFQHKQMEFKDLVICVVLGLLYSSLFAVFKESIPGLADMMRTTRIWEAEEEVYRFSGLYPDPNYYTAMIILCSVSLLTMYACRIMKWDALALFAVLTICGAATGSKSYLLMLCAVLAGFVVCLFITKRYALGMIALAMVALFGIAVFSGRIEMFNNILIRFEGSDISTGRLEIWKDHIEYLFQDLRRLAFGVGLGVGNLEGAAAHNTFLDFAYYYGLFGTALWLTLCVSAIGKIRVTNIYVSLPPMICLAVISMFLSYLLFYDFAFALIFVIYALKGDFYKKQPHAIA